MTTLDPNTPIPLSILAEIEKRNRVALKAAEDPACSLHQPALDRAMLCAEVDRRLPIADVERFLKRERDEYEPRGECWNTVDDVLDCFRLHMVTGTPLTEPRPEEGPSDPSVGRPPLTEAEELRIEVDRLTAERNRLSSAARDSDAYALDKELNEANAERADLDNQVSVLKDHVAALESDARAALAVDWDTLRAQIGNTIAAGTAGAFPLARVVDEVMAAVRKAVQP